MENISKSNAEYISILEDALAAAIVCLFTTHQADCLRTFTRDELKQVLNRTRAYSEGTTVEDIYAKALRFPRQSIEDTKDTNDE